MAKEESNEEERMQIQGPPDDNKKLAYFEPKTAKSDHLVNKHQPGMMGGVGAAGGIGEQAEAVMRAIPQQADQVVPPKVDENENEDEDEDEEDDENVRILL